MSLETVVDVLLGITPVPGLSAAFTLFKFIVSSVQEVQASKTQLEALAKAIGDLLTTLNSEFKASRLVAAACVKPLDDLRSLVEDVYRFVQKEQDRGFLKSLLNKDSRTAGIEGFYRRIGITVNAFQISALLNVQGMLIVDKRARNQDMDALTARLQNLERSQSELRRTLDINQNNMIAMMVSIERKLDGRRMNDPEHRFYSHTLQYLTSTSGKQVKVEDWMISTFDIDYGPEIGVGGFGKVYRGTWNRTEVAIKVVQNVVGVIPTSEVLRKEIEIWSTLRHPNILQFLGANTLDERPFIVMPYMPSNAREFLRKRPDFDPLYILRDISLGLEYLHSRKICHGDLKGINVLIDDSSRALLCDFGLSRVKSDVASRTNAVDNPATLGSRNWMAPELLTGSLPKLPSDIYAFGMTIYELCTDENPFSSVAYGDFIELVFRLVVRPNRPDVDDFPKLGDSLWSLAERCWVADPKARPTAPNIHDAIIEMISESTRSVVLGSSVSETESTGTVNPQPYSHP
ncbi:kinase-like domain-containing protein [Mycena sp. CBHHK59/15]|nr:kinase-like domain-containing protein [Mycena sp. CBHHK59/15]